MQLHIDREELDDELCELRSRLPQMIAEYRLSADFRVAFGAYADAILGDASPQDLAYVRTELRAMLEHHGMEPLR